MSDGADDSQPLPANLPESPQAAEGASIGPPNRRRKLLPAFLFVATCASTFITGMMFDPDPIRGGLIYMTAVMSILLAHELGHFVAAWLHRVYASFPFFLPFPGSPIGTMGAVIAMDGYSANRKQLFDIGIAGPLAGLILAIPITWKGIEQAEPVAPEIIAAMKREASPFVFKGYYHDPLLVKLMMRHLRADGAEELALNPLLLAGWVGFLITGLNMMPISQLDGGHVAYALLGRRAHTVAKLLVAAALIFMVWEKVYMWSVMLVVVLLIGINHPPTADDNAPLGPFRLALGWASLLIPVLCFPPHGLS